jgi:hypothetical protein
VGVNQCGTHWTDIRVIWYWGASIKKSIKKLQISSKSGKKYRPFYVKTKVRFVVAFDIMSPLNSSLRVKLYEAVRAVGEVQTLRERATFTTLLFY